MLRYLACCLCLLLLTLPARAGILVIAYMDEAKVALVDSETNQTLATLDTGRNPHEVRISPDRRHAYVAAGKTITVIDLRNRKVQANFDLGSYSAHDIRVSRDGRRIWAACAAAKAVIELDSKTGALLKAYNTDREGSYFVEITPDEKKLYTSNLEGKSVSIIDRQTGKVNVIPMDYQVYGIDITPDGKQIWVSGRDVVGIDTLTDKVFATIKTPESETGRIRLTSNGKKLVVALAKKVVVYDVKTQKQLFVADLNSSPKVLTLSKDGRRAYLTNPVDHSVSVVDVMAGKQLTSFQTGKKPDGIGWVD